MNRFLSSIVIILLIVLLFACQAPDDGQSPAAAEEPAVEQAVQENAEETVEQATESEATAEPVLAANAAAPWKLIKQLQPEHKPKYAAFMNELFGVSGCGEKLQPSFTADGGQTWYQPVMGQFCPDSVDIVDGRNIWLCNSFGVFHSEDGGKSLVQMYSPYDGCRILSFVDGAYGWSSFDWNLAATEDGAMRWTEVEKESTMADIAAIFRRSPAEGYVLTYDGHLFTTTDSGGSWSSTDLGLVDGEMRIANMDGRPPVAMRFQDSDNGIIVLALAGRGDTKFLALHTDDGGRSWAQYDLPLNLGPIYLSHDGRFLTVTELGGAGTITIMENQLLAE